MGQASVYKSYQRKRQGDTVGAMTIRYSIDKVPEPLTGYQLNCQFRFQNAEGAVTKEISIGDGITIVDELGGIFKFDPFINEFESGKHVYDLEFTHPDTVTKNTFLYGDITSFKDVTRV